MSDLAADGGDTIPEGKPGSQGKSVRRISAGGAAFLALLALAIVAALSPWVPEPVQSNDIYVHAALWFALTALAAVMPVPLILAGVLLAGLSFGLEILQAFVPGRTFSLSDLAANGAGIAAALGLGIAYRVAQAAPAVAAVRNGEGDRQSRAVAAQQSRRRGAGLAGMLFIAILGSPLVFVEPSPYEGLALLLAAATLLSGPALHRSLLPLLVLLVVFFVGGVLATMPVMHDGEAVTYLAVTIYLGVTALIFALLFSDDVMRRLAALRAAYIFAASLVALLGAAVYFGILPFAELMLENGRVRGTFQDPNVFGPYLILPMLLIIQNVLRGRFRFGQLLALVILTIGLFLSFSRGAWGHFALSTVVMVGLMFATEGSARIRTRYVVGAVAAGIATLAFLAALLTVPAVQTMFEERAELVQDYDAGYGGRFDTQLMALDTIVQNPNGVGPRQFAKNQVGKALAATDAHQVYITALLSYGWLGGFAYIALVLITLQQGFLALVKRTPWQPWLIACYATFLGVALEGLIIDTDHWRHWYLLVGMIWGLVAATARYEEGRNPAPGVNRAF